MEHSACTETRVSFGITNECIRSRMYEETKCVGVVICWLKRSQRGGVVLELELRLRLAITGLYAFSERGRTVRGAIEGTCVGAAAGA